MRKKEVKAVLKNHGYKLIKPSWFDDKVSEHDDSAIFRAYDETGACFEWYVNWETRRARKQMLSSVNIHEALDVSFMFFEDER